MDGFTIVVLVILGLCIFFGKDNLFSDNGGKNGKGGKGGGSTPPPAPPAG